MIFFQTYLLPILLGVGSTILVFITKSFFYNAFLPWYEENTYRGHKIDGEWQSQFASHDDSGINCEEFITIRQFSEKIDGDIFYNEIKKEDGSIIRKKQFKFEGEYVDSVLTANYRNTNPHDKGRGTFCLVSTHSDTLIGKYSWLEPDTNKIEADVYKWERKR